MSRSLLSLAATASLLLAGACATTPRALSPFEGGRWVDLTHAFGPDTIYWPTAAGFRLTIDAFGVTDKGYFYSSNSYAASEHGGTHVDSPIHFAAERRFLAEIPVDELIGPAAVVDVSAACAADRDHQISVDDLRAWESEHGPIPDGAILLLNTGFHRHWPERVAYMGTDERGAGAVAKLHFPGLHPDAAAWLVAERDILAVGLDTPSIDFGQSTHFESHQILFEANIPAFENVAALSEVPATGAQVIALPMKIARGTGGPLRIVAWVPSTRP